MDKSSYQDRYIALKNKYAKQLIENWAETTDPLKHVFEDISLATFLILLWEQDTNRTQRTFVDLGCGNGVLVYILVEEGYNGYGIDVRKRKSWTIFPENVQAKLHEKILLPHFLCSYDEHAVSDKVHPGIFSPRTFFISNHSDELTPYTPLLAALTPQSQFLCIPCCEHDFSGGKISQFRINKMSDSANLGRYGMYCEWISDISRALGWEVKREMLRIPSTRNVGIIGGQRNCTSNVEVVLQIVKDFGGDNGCDGFIERALGLKNKVHEGH